ncbi:MAG TPA: tyrosine-type recombinase/integrase [Methylococcaceae bacterium]|nr:tyrosine-type recombinase/integrase [Methylococcaceae bacterium]
MRKIPGLRFDGKQWIIDKRVKGLGRIFERTGFGKEEVEKAQQRYHGLMKAALDKGKRAKEGEITFAEAAARHLREATKRSLERDMYALEKLVPVIGSLTLNEIHQGTLQPYIQLQREKGLRSASVARELTVVRRILTLAARVWRNEDNRPFLGTVPLLIMPNWEDQKAPYPLNWDEQTRLFQELPDYLARMATFAVNTGLREQGVCWLRWDWEVEIPELQTSVFVVPGCPVPYPDGVWPGEKNKEDQVVVLNRAARLVVEECRGNGSAYVFARKGKRLAEMHSTAWDSAWRRSGLPADRKFCRGPHNLKHTFGRRLRAAEVPIETRKVLLHHTNGDVTLRYSPAEIQELIKAVEKLTEMRPVTLLRRVA